MPTLEQIRAEADATAHRAATEWGAFRRYISANPLTGFWIGVLVGGVIGFAFGHGL